MSASSAAEILVAYDFNRLAKYLERKLPSGIERVDINYLSGLLADPRFEVKGVLEADVNGRKALLMIRDDLMKAMFQHLYSRWIGGDADEQAFLDRGKMLLKRLRESFGNLRIDARSSVDETLVAAAKRFSRKIYLNACFFDILDGEAHARLIRASGLKPTYVVHDLIGIEFPEYCVAGLAARQFKSLMALSRVDATIIAISDHVRSKIRAVLDAASLKVQDIRVNRNGVDDKFFSSTQSGPSKQNQFVYVSTIEPRKNHALLLNVWRKLINENGGGGEIPKLVLIGRRGWSNQTVFDTLDHNAALREHVIELNSCPDDEMIRIIQNSKASLFPSFDEGWGLPIVESLALGTPVICSNIPVLHECTNGKGLFLDPIDGLGWYETIKKVSQGELVLDAGGFRPISWKESVSSMKDILSQV